MRNAFTDNFSTVLNKSYHDSGLSPNDFIKRCISQERAADVEYLNKSKLTKEGYASMNLLIFNTYVHCYYVNNRDTWFTKI